MPRTFDKFLAGGLPLMFQRVSLKAAATLMLAAALFWPAAYNGFPLIFPDTSAYLQVALGHSWTLDRSGFYGLALKPVSLIDPGLGLWIATALQCLIIAAVVAGVSFSLVRPSTGAVLAIVALCLLTALPWHAAQLMPDAFTGAMILLAWLLAISDIREPGVPLLWLAAAALILAHYTHLLIFPIVFLAAMIARAAFGCRSAIKRNFLALVACCSAVVVAHVSANGIMFDRWTVAPMGPYFLFARLYEDGIAVDWMDKHCGSDASPELCALRSEMPSDSQKILWGGSKSPFDSRINRLRGAAGSWVWIDRMQQADRGSIREHPLRFAGDALEAGSRQFVRFRALDDECPSECQFHGLTKSLPRLGAEIHRSRQVQSSLPKKLIQRITIIVSVAGLLLMPLVLALAIRRKDSPVVSIAVAVMVALCLNALITGALSDVHDRYQSRVVWLAPLVALLAAVRWFQLARARDPSHLTPAHLSEPAAISVTK